MTLKQLQEKIQKDYEELVKEGEPYGWSYFLRHAYRYAHYNEVLDFFDNLEEEDFNEDWKDLIGEIKEEVNIIEGIYNSWLNYNHPEYYNFFEYGSFVDIVRYYFKKIYQRGANHGNYS